MDGDEKSPSMFYILKIYTQLFLQKNYPYINHLRTIRKKTATLKKMNPFTKILKPLQKHSKVK